MVHRSRSSCVGTFPNSVPYGAVEAVEVLTVLGQKRGTGAELLPSEARRKGNVKCLS